MPEGPHGSSMLRRSVPSPRFHEVGCSQYPLIALELSVNTDVFMQHLVSQHYAFCCGDVRAELKELCHLLEISVIE